MYAKGGAFTNSIVSKPTAFQGAGGLGVMGEAGPEAILPLTRTSSGALGVTAVVNTAGMQNGAGGGGILVNVNINGDQKAESSTNDSGYEQFGQSIAQMIQQEYRRLITKDLSPGGQVWQQMTPRS
jgi:phage-related minor tail protein